MTTERDRSIERLLRETRAGEPGSPPDCPDAETLAAMADDTLSAGLRREIEGHVAGCHRCQALTAAMVRADAPVGSISAADDVSAWKRRALNWLVPAAVAATAVALWVLVPGQQTPTPTAPTADTQVATAPPPLPPPTPEVITIEPLRLPAEERADSAARDQTPGAPVAATPASPAASAPPPPAAAPPPPPAAQAEAAKAESPSVGRLQDSTAERRNEGALNETVALQERAANVQARRVASVEIASPDPRVRWRVGPGLVVQRSTDGGATWVAQQTGASVELTAGSAPGVDVCWLVGRGGIVLRTTDGGRQWQRVPFPDMADVTAITASTARNATVTLADGRRFSTDDGGTTWMAARQ